MKTTIEVPNKVVSTCLSALMTVANQEREAFWKLYLDNVQSGKAMSGDRFVERLELLSDIKAAYLILHASR